MGTKTLRDQRRALLWWSLGFVFTVFMYTAFWPNVHANAAQFNQYLEKLPEAIKNALGGASFGSPEGYVQTEVFSLLGPVLLLVYAIGAGTRAIAGEAEGRTLDLLLSTPLSRRRLVMEKFGAMAAATLFLAILMALSLEAIGPLYDLGLSPSSSDRSDPEPLPDRIGVRHLSPGGRNRHGEQGDCRRGLGWGRSRHRSS